MLAGALVVGTQGDALGIGSMPNLVLGMIFSAAILLPTLWSGDGLLSDLGLSGPNRTILALLLPLICVAAGTPFGIDSFAVPPAAA